MATRKQRSIDELIQFYKDKARELEKKKKIKSERLKNLKLKRSDEGMTELIDQFDKVTEMYRLNGADLIKQLSRIKRTGLLITESKQPTV